MLVDPPGGIDYGVQKGSGANYETLFVRQGGTGDVAFEFSMPVKDNRAGSRPHFLGPFAQGPAAGRFVYVDVGTYAGQRGTPWSRRMKVPLDGLTSVLVKKAIDRREYALQARIPGTGSDGGPNCGTVTLLGDWELVEAKA